MLVKTYNAYDLKNDFERYDRDYYSLDACQKMIDLFEECEGTQEVDIIGLCGDFTEETEEDIRDHYSNIESIRDSETTEELMSALNYYTYAVETDKGILYQNF